MSTAILRHGMEMSFRLRSRYRTCWAMPSDDISAVDRSWNPRANG